MISHVENKYVRDRVRWNGREKQDKIQRLKERERERERERVSEREIVLFRSPPVQ